MKAIVVVIARALLALGILAATSACFTAVPPEGDVLCSSNAECSSPRVCASARHVCVDAGTPPDIVDVQFDRAATSGLPVHLIISADDSLDPQIPPLVAFAAGTPALPLAFDAAVAGAFTQSFLIDGTTAPEGTYAVESVTVTDARGNRVTCTTADGASDTKKKSCPSLADVTLIVDRTAPALLSGSVDAPGLSAATFSEQPDGNDVHMTGLASEPLSAARIDIGAPGASVGAPCTVAGASIDCATTILATVTTGSAPVLLTLVDLAGNTGTGALDDILVDTSPPDVAAGTLRFIVRDGSNVVDAMTSTSRAELSFDTNEPVVGDVVPFVDVPSAPLSFAVDASATGAGLHFALDAIGTTPPGSYAIKVSLTDSVGHTITRTLVDALVFSAHVGCATPPGVDCVDLDGDGHFGHDNCSDGDDDDDGSPLVFFGAHEIPGNGVDEDQNGGDADFPVGAVFVDSEDGSDTTGDGSRAHPFLTISEVPQQGLFLAARETPYTLLVAVGNTTVVGGLDPARDWAPAVAPGPTTSKLAATLITNNNGASTISHVEVDAVTMQNNDEGELALVSSVVGTLEIDGASQQAIIVDSTIAHGHVDEGSHALFFRCDIADIEASQSHLILERSVVRQALVDTDAVIDIVSTALFGAAAPAILVDGTSTSASRVGIFHGTIIGDGVHPAIDASAGVGATVDIVDSLVVSPAVPAVVAQAHATNVNLLRSAFVTDGAAWSVVSDDGLGTSVRTCSVDNLNSEVAPCPSGNTSAALTSPGFSSLFHLDGASFARNGGAIGFESALGEPTAVFVDIDGECRFSDGNADYGADEVQ